MTIANRVFDIAVLPGDGIGPEVIDATMPLLEKLAHNAAYGFRFASHPAGAQHYKATGDALPEATFEAARAADAILFGAMGWPEIRYEDGTEVAPQLDLRVRLDLYAGVRPARAIPGVKLPLADPRAANIDLVVIRESTEGLFTSRGKGVVIEDREARDTMVITRRGSERVHDFSFRLAERRKRTRGRKGRVTCVDKANVFRSMAFFRKIFDERAVRFPGIEARHNYIDATALDMIRKPWDYDVLVMENMYGDILSDLTAGLVGGMGMAPSGDVGDDHALFQPCHGSAPDIAGEGKANPIATILSAAMMLDWLAERQRHRGACRGRPADRTRGRCGVRERHAEAVRVRRPGWHARHRRCRRVPTCSSKNPKPAWEASMNSTQTGALQQSEAEEGTVRRVALVLIPFLMVAYLVAFIDRINVGFAALQMNKDLGFTSSVFGFGGGLFFLTYFLCEVPSNLALQRFGARLWIARIMITWGIIASATAFVVGPWSFYAVRLLLGAAEAGFFPGVLLYLTYWFPAEYRARMVSLFYVAVPISGFVGSPISALLLKMDGIAGLKGWQWLYIVEGLMPVALGLITLVFLPDRPKDARFLTPEKRAWLAGKLEEEQRREVRVVQEKSTWAVMFNPQVLLLALVYAGGSAASNGLSIWQPQILKSFGLTNMQAGLINSVPFGIASVAMIAWALYSDRRRKRISFTILPLGLSVLALLGCVLSKQFWPVVFFLTLTLVGTFSIKAPFWALASETLSARAIAAGLAMINALGNLGGFLGTYLIGALRDATGSYLWALSPILVLQAIGCVVLLIIGQQQKRAAERARVAGTVPA